MIDKALLIRIIRQLGYGDIAAEPSEMTLAVAQAIWREAQQAEREACVKICEGIATDRWNLFMGRLPYTGAEGSRADPFVEGESNGAELCRAVIRARGENHGRIDLPG